MSEEEKIDYMALSKDWAIELMENPIVQEYCNPYRTPSLKLFCDAYARTKAFGMQYGEMYQGINEKKQNEWTDAGYEHLCIIQQKKLFDAHCLWRADQLEIKGVEICYDFYLWEEDVLNCPFIEPITEQEVDWYCQYLSQNNVELEVGWLQNWQDYEELKEAYQTSSGHRNLPEWYDFHNGKTGNGILLLLPDVRGEKEEFYRHLGREGYKKENPTPPYVRDPEFDKPFLDYFDTKRHINVAKKIEDKHTFGLMQEFIEATKHRHTYENERAEEDFRYLTEIKNEIVPIEAHYDYREALRRAVVSYRCRKIAEHLPFAFHKYERMRELGFALGTEVKNIKANSSIGNVHRRYILKGREVNGEPRDFNF